MTDNEFVNLLIDRGSSIGIILLVAVIAWFALRYLTKALAKTVQKLDKQEDSEFDYRTKTVFRFVNSLGMVIIFVTTLITILSELQINVAPLIASVGVAGLALGLGAQTMVKDAIAGLFIMLEDQFHVDDYIETAGVSGTVERIGLRTTSLRDLSGTRHIVPNGEIRIISNATSGWSRAKVEVYILHDEDIVRVKTLLRDKLHEVRELATVNTVALDDFTVSGPEDIDAWGQKIRILIKTKPGQHWSVQREVREMILELFRENKIAIAKPMSFISS